MFKPLILTVLMSLPALCGTVSFTPNGKMFHESPKCIALSRAKTVHASEQAEAERHGLKPCPICHRIAKKAPAPKPAKNDWARKAGK